MQKLLSAMYELVLKESVEMGVSRGTPKRGHQFEDSVSKAVHQISKEEGFRSTPPRHSLEIPTYSGISHQSDASFNIGDHWFLIECKRRQFSTKEQLYYFNSIIADYVLGIRQQKASLKVKGIFLSTAPVDDNSFTYALAYGITVIEPTLPPPEYVIYSATGSEEMRQAFIRIFQEIPRFHPSFSEELKREISPFILQREYRFLLQRCKGAWSDQNG